MADASLVDIWLTKLKNHPIVATIIIAASVIGGAASLSKAISDLLDVGDTPGPQPQLKVVVDQRPISPLNTEILLNCKEMGLFTVNTENATVYGGERQVYTERDAVPIYTGDTEYGFWMYRHDKTMWRRYHLNRSSLTLHQQEIPVTIEERDSIQAQVDHYLETVREKIESGPNPRRSAGMESVAHTDQLVMKLMREKGLSLSNMQQALCDKTERKL